MKRTAHPFCTLFLFSFALIFFSSCAGTAKFTTNKLNSSSSKPTLLVFPIDIALFELSVGGVAELKADWTEKAKANVAHSIKELFNEKHLELHFYDETNEPNTSNVQKFKLLKMVGSSIYNHYYIPTRSLPSKKEFSWSVGEAATSLKEKYQADYALYVSISDTYSTERRVALGIITGLLFGYVPPSGIQRGTAYLIDLGTGDVVWFNHIAKESFGDIRETKTTTKALTALFSEFPK